MEMGFSTEGWQDDSLGKGTCRQARWPGFNPQNYPQISHGGGKELTSTLSFDPSPHAMAHIASHHEHKIEKKNQSEILDMKSS